MAPRALGTLTVPRFPDLGEVEKIKIIILILIIIGKVPTTVSELYSWLNSCMYPSIIRFPHVSWRTAYYSQTEFALC